MGRLADAIGDEAVSTADAARVPGPRRLDPPSGRRSSGRATPMPGCSPSGPCGGAGAARRCGSGSSRRPVRARAIRHAVAPAALRECHATAAAAHRQPTGRRRRRGRAFSTPAARGCRPLGLRRPPRRRPVPGRRSWASAWWAARDDRGARRPGVTIGACRAATVGSAADAPARLADGALPLLLMTSRARGSTSVVLRWCASITCSLPAGPVKSVMFVSRCRGRPWSAAGRMRRSALECPDGRVRTRWVRQGARRAGRDRSGSHGTRTGIEADPCARAVPDAARSWPTRPAASPMRRCWSGPSRSAGRAPGALSRVRSTWSPASQRVAPGT